MKPDWEGIGFCLAIVAGVWWIGGQRWAGISLVLVALILARAKKNRSA
jgi:multidrug transporter EmrE-like cation transporter